ncbi:hypothetical protein EW146_g9539 [Bondarzewia mesenterica]|uniref:Alginate lyase domain-containing protein n=1 Tax=Bondarzewia mesenterica TaxID=1095465 RepID=A0A4S4L6T9_9AGAM|nr:hypothetical protein EW146_g9539 [Bondarzewia mesenterica]
MFQVASRPVQPSYDMQMQQPNPLPGLSLPRTLARPAFVEVSRENIAAIDPGLVQVPFEYIRNGLHAQGAEMYASVSRLPIPSSVLKSRVPTYVEVPIVTSSLPTHILAVSTSASSTRPQPISETALLIPTQHIVLAANCAKLPRMPASRPQVRANGTAVVPVITLTVPVAEAFAPLHTFLISRRFDKFLCSLLPVPSSMVSPLRAGSSASPNPLAHLSASQLATYLAASAAGDKMSALMGIARSIIGFRRTTPGNTAILLTPEFNDRHEVVDPTHPLSDTPPSSVLKMCPSYRTPRFYLYAFPKALLQKKEIELSGPFKLKYQPATKGRREDGTKVRRRRVDMSLVTVLFNKKIVLAVCLRDRLKRRVKAALQLIVTRGANVRMETCMKRGKAVEEEVIYLDENDANPEKWVSQDWSYAFVPTNEMFRCPWPEMIKLLRTSLTVVNRGAKALERRWAKMARRTPTAIRNTEDAHNLVSLLDELFTTIEGDESMTNHDAVPAHKNVQSPSHRDQQPIFEQNATAHAVTKPNWNRDSSPTERGISGGAWAFKNSTNVLVDHAASNHRAGSSAAQKPMPKSSDVVWLRSSMTRSESKGFKPETITTTAPLQRSQADKLMKGMTRHPSGRGAFSENILESDRMRPLTSTKHVWTTCPYYQRDGLFNPDVRLVNNTGDFSAMADAVLYNAMAWALNGTDSYAANAVSFIKAWFLDDATKMNPNLNYAQMNRGPSGQKGAHTGVLCVPLSILFLHRPVRTLISLPFVEDLKCFVKIVNGVLILENENSQAWTSDIKTQMTNWTTEYIQWLETDSLALAEATAPNNHGTFYFNQLAALKILVGDVGGARNVTQTYFDTLFMNQIDANGEQPLEAIRTRPYHYRSYNLAAMITNARIAAYAGSTTAWNYTTTKGGTILAALDFAMTVPPKSEVADELYPIVAAIAAVYGDPEGKYVGLLNGAEKGYAAEPYFLWDQPLSDSGYVTAVLKNDSASGSGSSSSSSGSKGLKSGARTLRAEGMMSMLFGAAYLIPLTLLL